MPYVVDVVTRHLCDGVQGRVRAIETSGLNRIDGARRSDELADRDEFLNGASPTVHDEQWDVGARLQQNEGIEARGALHLRLRRGALSIGARRAGGAINSD